MMGPPDFSDHPVSTWEEFCQDWNPHYFDGSKPDKGRCFVIMASEVPVGVICYNDICNVKDQHRITEIDIWMSCRANCGKGYGPGALETLCGYLSGELGITECFLQPSARNQRAIHAYEKAGFQRVNATPDEAAAKYKTRPDYYDSTFMVKQLKQMQY